MLRSIDRFIDLSEVREKLAGFYSHTGRPSVDPELMIRMLLVGYCFGIRSERRLCEEVHLNLVYRWFCRLGLDGRVPDHSTFSKTGMDASGRAISLGVCSRWRCLAVLMKVFVDGEGFAVEAALSRQMPIARAALKERLGQCRKRPIAPSRNT
jgi:Transposase domain (DUF772)